MRLFAAALLVLALPAAAQPAPAATADQDIVRRISSGVVFMASENLAGGDTGSSGYNIALDYVRSQFRSIGLEPASEIGGWYQQVPFRRASFDKPPSLSLTVGGSQVALEQGKE